MGLFGHYLPRESLKELRNYKYTCGGDYTPLERIFNVFWEYLVSCVPKFVAPNLITLVGFVCASFGFFLMTYFVGDSTAEAPRFVYIIVAFLFWIYQTFDAIDGKQARRTKSSSALGTLFDHGCDIFISIAMAFCVVMATGSGYSTTIFWTIIVSSQVPQFLLIWWEYYFHVFFVNFGNGLGVTEAQFVIQLIFLANFVFGPGFWSFSVSSLLPPQMRDPLEALTGGPLLARSALTTFLLINNCTTTIYTAILGLIQMPTWSRKLEAAAQLGGFSVFLLAEWQIYHSGLVSERLSSQLPVYMLLIVSYAVVAIRLLMASLCKRKYLPVQWPVLPTISLALFLLCSGPKYLSAYVSTDQLVWAVLLWQILYAGDFLRTSVLDICETLNIYCFSLAPFKPPTTEMTTRRSTKKES